MPPAKHQELTTALLSDIPIAARRYLQHEKNTESKFSAYFTWYGAQRINPENLKRREFKKRALSSALSLLFYV
jgi:hypothetical protein